MAKIEIRKAKQCDLTEIKRLADEERNSIGFITRGTFKKSIENGNVLVILWNEKVVGFQHYYHRKRDYQTTLYQKTIDKKYRNRGLGRLLVIAVIEEAKLYNHKILFLKCPENLSSNEFYKKCGFVLIGQETGKKRRLNLWEYRINK